MLRRVLLPRDVRRALDEIDENQRKLLTDIVLAVTLRVAALMLIPLLVAVALSVRESRERTKANKALIVAIDRSRAETTYSTCISTNDRHDRTVDQLDKLLNDRKLGIREQIRVAEERGDDLAAEALRAQIDALDASRASTVSLIDALQPFVNCEQLMIDRFGYVPEIPRENRG